MDADQFSPTTKATKSVSIAESDHISPLLIGNNKDPANSEDPLDLDRPSSSRHFLASLGGKRLHGRPSFERLSSRASANETPLAPILDEYFTETSSSRPASHPKDSRHNIVAQVTAWVKHERARRESRRSTRKARKAANADAKVATAEPSSTPAQALSRRDSDSSEGSVALENLAAILEQAMVLEQQQQRKHSRSRPNSLHAALRKSGSIGKLRRKSTVGSSDTESHDNEIQVPHADVSLDNSKTLAYGGGGAESSIDLRKGSVASEKTKYQDGWALFKSEIVRLTHTLRLKGWRRVPREISNEIEVKRLSGALTNAVYVVSPPKKLPDEAQKDDGQEPKPSKKRPPKLLLRIYGPQVEHLIDREAELQILRRLARKRIGPRLLGTFINGRFEEYLHAETLTPRDLRVPETSKQIAKRMRELHEGIELLPKEREGGPFVWKNWDKWVDRCEQIVTWLDKEVNAALTDGDNVKSSADAWKKRGYVCGVEWETFRKTLEKYRKWLNSQYGGEEKVKQRLVFAHNDTQYGNILRMTPAGESPLLLPANVHKQLVVIDFEYANANLPGLEFANHFTEWCYNYHDPKAPHQVNTAAYPSPQEQHRFVRAYTLHRPGSAAAADPPTPKFGASAAPVLHHSSSSISTLLLDSRAPPSPDVQRMKSTKERAAAEDQRGAREDAEGDAAIEEEVQRLLAETRVWRLANSAQWVAWGVVQAKVDGMPAFDGGKGKTAPGANGEDGEDDDDDDTVDGDEGAEMPQQKYGGDAATEGGDGGEADGQKENGDEDVEEEEEEFDYLAYAQDRAMFFWGDAITLGLAQLEDLPEGIRERVKFVNY